MRTFLWINIFFIRFNYLELKKLVNLKCVKKKIVKNFLSHNKSKPKKSTLHKINPKFNEKVLKMAEEKKSISHRDLSSFFQFHYVCVKIRDREKSTNLLSCTLQSKKRKSHYFVRLISVSINPSIDALKWSRRNKINK